jgi:hypothetical protein
VPHSQLSEGAGFDFDFSVLVVGFDFNSLSQFTFHLLQIPHELLITSPSSPRETFLVMSLNVFIAICVLACDFLIYAFFQWTFGAKHREFRRPIPKSAPLPKSTRKIAIELAPPTPYMAATPERYRHTERHVA